MEFHKPTPANISRTGLAKKKGHCTFYLINSVVQIISNTTNESLNSSTTKVRII
jgi:hypothetical protein